MNNISNDFIAGVAFAAIAYVLYRMHKSTMSGMSSAERKWHRDGVKFRDWGGIIVCIFASIWCLLKACF